MATSSSQPKTAPARATISGISLLMLVAFAVQASAGLMTPAVQARHDAGLPVVRYIAEVMTRQAQRQVKRQQERPALRKAVVSTSRRGAWEPRVADGRGALQTRRLQVFLTNLPPPADALA